MFDRFRVGTLLFVGLAVALSGCGTSEVDSIVVTPASVSMAAGAQVQLTATGLYGHGTHPSTSEDVTDLVTWSTPASSVATVSSTGLVTAVGAGSIPITASMKGFTGVVSGSATITVTGTTGGGGGTGGDVTTLSIIPSSQSVASPGETGQFIAIGTTVAGATKNLTTSVAWTSSSQSVATICTAGSALPCTSATDGLATAVNQGTATMTAVATNADGTVATATAPFTVVGAAAEPITALTILPSSQGLSASGQTGQFIAIGTSGTTGLQQDLTNSASLTWSSSIPTIATVTSGLTTCTNPLTNQTTNKCNGIASGVSAGSSTITAQWTNPDNSVLTATATVNVSLTAAPEPLLSLIIIPSTISVGNLQDTGNFLAIGTYSTAPTVRDLTSSVTWLSSEPNVFPVNTNSTPPNPAAPGGVVTAYGNGSAVIIAEATDPTTGSIQTATATFSCPLVLPNPNGNPPTPGSCYPGSQASGLLVTLTVYNEGLNTANWLVTAPSATNTANVIHCGPGWAANGNTGGSVCTATYPLGTTVTLTAPAQTGVSFGGWSYNCTPTVAVNALGPNSCQVTLGDVGNSNVTVGAIFN
ncbi:MAG: Ig-like domain-containing protein [Terracidiphilus sp.]